jgi:hypothetical protein
MVCESPMLGRMEVPVRAHQLGKVAALVG